MYVNFLVSKSFLSLYFSLLKKAYNSDFRILLKFITYSTIISEFTSVFLGEQFFRISLKIYFLQGSIHTITLGFTWVDIHLHRKRSFLCFVRPSFPAKKQSCENIPFYAFWDLVSQQKQGYVIYYLDLSEGNNIS